MVEILLIVIAAILLLPLLPFLFTAIGRLLLAIPAGALVIYVGGQILGTDGGWVTVVAIAVVFAAPFAAMKIGDTVANAWGRRQRLFRRRPSL